MQVRRISFNGPPHNREDETNDQAISAGSATIAVKPILTVEAVGNFYADDDRLVLKLADKTSFNPTVLPLEIELIPGNGPKKGRQKTVVGAFLLEPQQAEQLRSVEVEQEHHASQTIQITQA